MQAENQRQLQHEIKQCKWKNTKAKMQPEWKEKCHQKAIPQKGAIPSLFYFVEPTVNIKNETLEIDVSSLDVDFSIMVETIEVYEQGMIILF